MANLATLIQANVPELRVPKGIFTGITAFVYGFYSSYEGPEPALNDEIREEMMNDEAEYDFPQEIVNELTEDTLNALQLGN